MITEKDLIKLNEYLPIYATTVLASINEVTPQYVRMVLKGERLNDKILEQAVDMAIMENEKQKLLKTKINSIDEPEPIN